MFHFKISIGKVRIIVNPEYADAGIFVMLNNNLFLLYWMDNVFKNLKIEASLPFQIHISARNAVLDHVSSRPAIKASPGPVVLH